MSKVQQDLEEARSQHTRASSQLRQEMSELATCQNRRSMDEEQQIAMLNATNAHLLQVGSCGPLSSLSAINPDLSLAPWQVQRHANGTKLCLIQEMQSELGVPSLLHC